MGFKTELADLYRYRNAYGLTMSAAMGFAFIGWDIGLIGGVLSLPSFQKYFGLDKRSPGAFADVIGNIVAVLNGGAILGALFSGYFPNRFGRKLCIIASGVICIAGSIVQSVSGMGSGQVVGLRVLLFSRFLGGVGVGMVTTLVPPYVSESTPRVIRGRCAGLMQLALNVGIMLSYWVNYSASMNVPFGEMQWRIPFVIQIIPGTLFIILMTLQPESPRWLVEHERYDEAARTLAYVAPKPLDNEAVVLTLNQIKADFLGKQKISIWKQIRMMGESRSTAVRCFIPCLMMFLQKWSGITAVGYFSPQIFASLGLSRTTSGLFATGIYGIVQVVSVSLTLIYAVERIGRKNCLIIGGLGQALAMIWIGGYSAIHPQPTIVPASYVSIVAVYAYAIFYSIGWGPIPFAVVSEIAPNHTRTAVLSIATMLSGVMGFVIAKITPILLVRIGYGTFLLYGFCCLIMGIWPYVFLPETKGTALEDIRYLFEKDMIVRALQDAPGGRIFLGKRRAPPVAELIKAALIERDELASDRKQVVEEKPGSGIPELRRHSRDENMII